MIFNAWLKDVNRLRISRNSRAKGKRLDFAERLDDFNENFFNKFIKSINQEDLITYPSYADYNKLEAEIAKYNKVNKSNIYFNSGSDACLKDIIQLFCKAGDNIVGTMPSFPMYSIYSKVFNVKFNYIEVEKSISVSFDKLLKKINKKTKVVILTNPNSPYGDYKSINEIEKFVKKLNRLKLPLLIDEAYVEFSPGSCKKLINKYKNIFVLRTFSKAWGAAGVRLGYIIGNKNYIEYLKSLQLTYPISNISLKFVLYLLANSKVALKNASQTIKSRDSLCKILSKNHYDVIRSHTNSIHFHHKTNDNSKIINNLLKKGYCFKHGSTKTGTPVKVPGDRRGTWIRISVGPNIEKDKIFLQCLGITSSK